MKGIFSKVKQLNTVQLVIIISLCFVGLFHEFLSCLADVVLLIVLFRQLKSSNWNCKIRINVVSIFVLSMVLLYGLSSIWAVDSGMAIFGFFKFLPILLLVLIVQQKEYVIDEVLEVIPSVMILMTLLSLILMQVDSIEDYFSVAGRMTGFFQYANTYALMALVSIIIEVTRGKLGKMQLFSIPILLFGVIYSGSRTVFILTALTVALLVLLINNKRVKISLLAAFIAVVIIALVYVKLTGKFYAIGRFLTISLTESTFVGRILYWQDALKVIAKHPFGTGYMGFYYLQQVVQTGVYSIRYIHNDLIQILLDVGWVPAALLLISVFKAFFKKNNTLRNRLLIFVIFAHACFDFDFQFVAVFMVFILLLDTSSGKEYSFRIKKTVYAICCMILLSSYIGISLSLSYFNHKELASKLYPWNTQDNIYLLQQMTDTFEMSKFADKILKQNKYVTIAYDANAFHAYSKGDLLTMSQYKDLAIHYSPFLYSEYTDYCYKLIEGIKYYQKSGDFENAEFCQNKLNEVVATLRDQPNRISKFGNMINAKLQTWLPDDILKYVESE